MKNFWIMISEIINYCIKRRMNFIKILFCKISCMKYYKGAGDNDKPLNGGKFVVENGFGHEEFNFLPVK